MSIELDPSNQLSFRRPLTEAIKETLTIRNPTQLPIAFKVKTTAPKQYCVRPNSGRVEPGRELEVQVQMQAMKEDPPADFKCKDKFLVQSIAITAEREQLPPAELWPTIEQEAKDQIREKKIRCAFLPPLDATAQGEQNTHNVDASSPTHSFQQSEPAPGHSPSPHTEAIRTGVNSSPNSAEVLTLKRELETAQETIHTLRSSIDKLQQETNTLRQRKPESSSSPAPTPSVVHLNQAQVGYPITYVVGAAVVAFLFAYLFF
ncbi:phosphatidylinositol-binding protein scs2 [Mortierella sp. AD011]|nr:phosphatidylinositol-binding protein scs2 [Mortierella sp. AD010]KAF9399348.1 phosphatidylinositol-binding protein scs2 [Mortierella sp. AD011]